MRSAPPLNLCLQGELLALTVQLAYHVLRSLVCVLFYGIDTGSTGSRGRTWGLPTYHLNSDAVYADLPLTLLGAPVSIGEASGGLMAWA